VVQVLGLLLRLVLGFPGFQLILFLRWFVEVQLGRFLVEIELVVVLEFAGIELG
jgi:hypothetical protein